MGLLLGNTDFQLRPKIFYGVEIWRLARLLQDLEILLTKPLLRCPGGLVGILFRENGGIPRERSAVREKENEE